MMPQTERVRKTKDRTRVFTLLWTHTHTRALTHVLSSWQWSLCVVTDHLWDPEVSHTTSNRTITATARRETRDERLTVTSFDKAVLEHSLINTAANTVWHTRTHTRTTSTAVIWASPALYMNWHKKIYEKEETKIYTKTEIQRSLCGSDGLGPVPWRPVVHTMWKMSSW